MSKSWNFNPKEVRRDGPRKKKRPQAVNKSEKRREERAIKTGDVSQFIDDEDELDRERYREHLDDLAYDDRHR